MRIYWQNLLPRTVLNRVARSLEQSNIKPGFPKKVGWLTIIVFISLTLAGYYPNLGLPPIKRLEVLAKPLSQEEIIAKSFSKPFNLPHPGYLTTRFSAYHPGIDLAAGLGMPIHPVTSGVVEKTGWDFFGLGNYVIVKHEQGLVSKYAHLGKIYVKSGDQVTPDSILGVVGLTGHTSGPHTHLEITLNNKFIDPQTILPDIPDMPKSLTSER